ncbi:DNA-3-methyladenine glycosylase family protein [Tumebacillus algifaecis]|nr:DNA-3-methyladenine glycosylase [Tumebacillus algifaecis]
MKTNPLAQEPSIIAGGCWEDNGQEIKLGVPKEYSFAENLRYLSKSPNECLFQIKDQKIYRALAIEDETPILEISMEHERVLTIRFLAGTAPTRQSVRLEVARYVSEWFDLETDLLPFYALAQSDVLLQRAVESFYGLRMIGIPDFFEAICWGIIGQQINLPFAYTLKRRLVESYGRRVHGDGTDYWLFPTPQAIAALSVHDLAGLQMTTRKSEYLIGVAQLIVAGRLSKELLSGAEEKQAEKMLTSIRGIGPWTANYVLMRCLHVPSAFPIDDVGLHNAIKYVLGTDQKPTKEEIRQFALPWKNWESYATFYLWRFLY